LVDAAALSVASDDVAGMVAAVAHLVALGHTAIAHVTGPDDLSMTHVRRAAFDDALRAAGLTADLVVTAQRYGVDEDQRAFAALLERRSPTAVIAGNLSGFLDPPLTTVAIPQYDIGATAAEMVLRQIGGNDKPEHRLLSTELAVRGSTAAHHVE
jgi:LacI family transcriptional regulator